MRKSGRIAHHDPDPRPPLPSRTDVFDPSVVQGKYRAPPVLGENLCELTAGGQGFLQRPGDYGLIN